MNIRLKRIIKIGLPLIIFLINICSAAEEENEKNQKKNNAILIFLLKQGVKNPQLYIISRIENKDNYLEEYDENDETKYRVKEEFKDMLVGFYNSLLEEKKVNLNNNDEEQWCNVDCDKKEHIMKLPTCGQEFCKYAFFLHLQCKLFDNKKIISCPKHKERTEGDKGHLCSFSLGEVKIKKDKLGKFLGKEVEFNKDLSKFLEEFGNRPISTKEDNVSLREFIKKIILGGANDKDFNTGDAKKCMYCCQTTLYKKNCFDGTKILCTGCGEEPICFKCLCKWTDSRINHTECIDSIDCDLFQEYGTGKIYVGEKNDYSHNDDGYEDFETNKYYHPRRCYSCKAYMGKDRACNHATCPCGAQWCWFCGAIYDDNHWNISANCNGLHLKGDYHNNFDSSLNEKMQLNDDDLLPWERKENQISKKEIQDFINLKKPILEEIHKKLMAQDENDQLCCNCFLDCLDEIKNCFSNI